jgi:hypothetical protein
MASMRCPECGREYALSATRCTVDDVELVETLAGDEPADAPEVSAPEAPETAVDDATIDASDDDGDAEDEEGDDREQVTYELGEWSGQDRVMLEQLLAGAGVARAWEGTDLVIRADDEELVDDLVEQVRATDEPVLDPEADKVVFEVNDWTSDQLVSLTDGLAEQGIAYEFDVEGDLVVLETDEDAVEALLDGIEFGDDVDTAERVDDTGPDDGLETATILSDLFVACDRLKKSATDHEGVLGVVSAADRLDGRPLPFGYVPSVWNDIQERAARLRSGLDDDETDDEELEEQADELWATLRNYV